MKRTTIICSAVLLSGCFGEVIAIGIGATFEEKVLEPLFPADVHTSFDYQAYAKETLNIKLEENMVRNATCYRKVNDKCHPR